MDFKRRSIIIVLFAKKYNGSLAEWSKAPESGNVYLVRKGVGSNPTAVSSFVTLCSDSTTSIYVVLNTLFIPLLFTVTTTLAYALLIECSSQALTIT